MVHNGATALASRSTPSRSRSPWTGELVKPEPAERTAPRPALLALLTTMDAADLSTCCCSPTGGCPWAATPSRRAWSRRSLAAGPGRAVARAARDPAAHGGPRRGGDGGGGPATSPWPADRCSGPSRAWAARTPGRRGPAVLAATWVVGCCGCFADTGPTPSPPRCSVRSTRRRGPWRTAPWPPRPGSRPSRPRLLVASDDAQTRGDGGAEAVPAGPEHRDRLGPRRPARRGRRGGRRSPTSSTPPTSPPMPHPRWRRGSRRTPAPQEALPCLNTPAHTPIAPCGSASPDPSAPASRR